MDLHNNEVFYTEIIRHVLMYQKWKSHKKYDMSMQGGYIGIGKIPIIILAKIPENTNFVRDRCCCCYY